jgi:hypothetical protein
LPGLTSWFFHLCLFEMLESVPPPSRGHAQSQHGANLKVDATQLAGEFPYPVNRKFRGVGETPAPPVYGNSQPHKFPSGARSD